MTKGIIYYTNNEPDPKLLLAVQKQIKKAKLPVVSVSSKPIDFGKNIVHSTTGDRMEMFEKILIALSESVSDIIFFCECDVLYHPSHFDFTPKRPDIYYYNTNVWKLRLSDGLAVKVDDMRQVSGLCGGREFLKKHYERRIAKIKKDGFSGNIGYEPGLQAGGYRIDDYKTESWNSPFPNIDIRHGKNLTKSRWSPDEFHNKRNALGWTESNIDNIPGWPDLRKILWGETK